MIDYITIPKFTELTGYTKQAIDTKIKRGVWLEDDVWVKAPDNKRLISIEGYESWVTGQEYGKPRKRA